MKNRFIKRLLFFGIPFYLVILLNYIVDPFNYNEIFDLGFNKKLISYKMNYRLYDILEYKGLRTPNILIGDSRIAAISTNEIKNVSGEKYYNFAFGSASLPECVNAFWYAASLSKLKKVYFGVPFNLFSGINNKNIFSQALKIADSPFDYYLNFFILKASLYNILFKVFHVNKAAETPYQTRNDFWRQQIRTAAITYRSFSWPYQFVKEILKIKQYCSKKGIEITIIIPPTHLDLQNLVNTYRLQNEYADYKKCLRSLAKVIDYDTYNEITMDKSNFKDPYHFNLIIMKRLVKEIWGKKQEDN